MAWGDFLRPVLTVGCNGFSRCIENRRTYSIVLFGTGTADWMVLHSIVQQDFKRTFFGDGLICVVGSFLVSFSCLGCKHEVIM